MLLKSAGNSAPVIGPEPAFSGQVRIYQLFTMPAPAQGSAGIVTFEPGARTAWHTHSKGQLLFVLSGVGWAQSEGGPRQTIHAGDTVWLDPNERHWHGATDKTAMSHVAIQEAQDGSPVTWAAPVTEADYLSMLPSED